MTDIPPGQTGSDPDQGTVIRPGRHMDSRHCAALWNLAAKQVSDNFGHDITIDFKQVESMDTAGVLFVDRLKALARKHRSNLHLANLSTAHQKQLDTMPRQNPEAILAYRPHELTMIQHTGQRAFAFFTDIHQFISFLGNISLALCLAVIRPSRLRWKETVLIAERSGVNALPIVALISFIVGLVMAFQAAMPMRMFGAEIFVANLIGIAMVRELGPLMTAIVLAGRSGSAFAAEMGTMKINEEIDALTTMGLDPVRFLIVPRVLAAMIMTPLLSLFANLMGIIGGAIVMLSLGYPLISYYRQIVNFVTWQDFTSGIVKCFCFGILIAMTGCIRGFQATGGPSAVGQATTSAVVTSIVLIAVVDGIFSVTYYYLGI